MPIKTFQRQVHEQFTRGHLLSELHSTCSWHNMFSIADVSGREFIADWLFQTRKKLLDYNGFNFQLRNADHHLADHHQADHHLADHHQADHHLADHHQADHHLADHHQADSDSESDDEVNRCNCS